MKRLKTVLILGLIILAAAAALALAAEPAQPVLPLRARVLEILQQHPEVWEEIQALEEDYGPPAADDETDSSSGLWGLMMGRGICAGITAGTAGRKTEMHLRTTWKQGSFPNSVRYAAAFAAVFFLFPPKTRSNQHQQSKKLQAPQ